MAEYRLTTSIVGVNPAALADAGAATATVSGMRDAATAIAAEQLAAHEALALLASQRRVSSRWSLVANDISGSISIDAKVDVRLLDLPESLVTDDVVVIGQFSSGFANALMAWIESDAGSDVKDLVDGSTSEALRFDNEFLASSVVAGG